MTTQGEASSPTFEDYPLTRLEYISALVHLYRGELNRANTWRIRLDTTTNWSILAVIGILTFAFGTADHSHASIILGMLFVLNFLALEARRYRIFDVWRSRVRMIEENFYGPLLKRDLLSPDQDWGSLVAKDLLEPRFKISYLEAFRARLVSNYTTIFAMLLLSWLVKVALLESPSGESSWGRFAVGPLPGLIPMLLVALLYLFLIGVVIFVPAIDPSRENWWTPRETQTLPDL